VSTKKIFLEQIDHAQYVQNNIIFGSDNIHVFVRQHLSTLYLIYTKNKSSINIHKNHDSTHHHVQHHRDY
jgi:hypothetical protein